jgi:ribonuclease HI
MPQALVIFTDASGSGNAYFSSREKVVQTGFSSAQCAELQAVISACQDFAHVPFNLYTDSAYVYSVVKTIETSYIGHTSNEQLFHLFHELRALLQQHQHPILWAISGPILSFLGHWQRAIARPMPWFLH